jgi:Tol biopolymer transport system component
MSGMSKRFTLWIVLLAACAVTGADAAAGTGRFAYETTDGLYVADGPGLPAHRIPGTGPGDGDPVWSPDGSKIAFDREQDGNGVVDDDVPRDVYVMNADGSDRRRLTFSRRDDGWPSWSPDNRALAFYSERRASDSAYVVNLATGQARLVGRGGYAPHWTPDRHVIYTDAQDRIVVAGPYGGHPRAVPGVTDALEAVVSPDGRRIVFSTDTDFSSLFTVAIDGGHREPLVLTNQTDALDPDWSADGSWVIYDWPDAVDRQSDVYAVRADGSETVQLTKLGNACCGKFLPGTGSIGVSSWPSWE